MKTVLRTYPHMEQQVAAMMIMMMVKRAEAARPGEQAIVIENGWSTFEQIYFWVVHILALVGLLALLAGIWWWRRPRVITVDTSFSCGHLVHARWSKKRPCLHCTP